MTLRPDYPAALDERVLGCTFGHYPWDDWERAALAAGVPKELAGLGRLTMREAYQHGWRDRLKSLLRLERRGQAHDQAGAAFTRDRRKPLATVARHGRLSRASTTRKPAMELLVMKVDFDQIKRTTDIVRVVESYGIALKKVGQDHVGLCPFHDDHHPSLRVTPAKGLVSLSRLPATGNVIQFVAKKEGIERPPGGVEAVEATPGVKSRQPSGSATGQGRAARTPSRAPCSRNPAALLQRVVTFYAKTLHKDRAGFEYLKSRNLVDAAMLDVLPGRLLQRHAAQRRRQIRRSGGGLENFGHFESRKPGTLSRLCHHSDFR